VRGQDQGRKPLVKVSCTRPHFTRQLPKRGGSGNRLRDYKRGKELRAGRKKTEKKTKHGRKHHKSIVAIVLGLSRQLQVLVSALVGIDVDCSQSLEVAVQPASPTPLFSLRLVHSSSSSLALKLHSFAIVRGAFVLF